MTATTADYLADLERRLASADPAMRAELLAGIREELDGLDPDAASRRMRELGDPARIASEALAATQESAPSHVAAPARRHDPVWYSVVTVLLLAIGGWVIPVLGGVAGLVMLWMSSTWRTVHKVVGTLAALSSPVLYLLWNVPWSSVTSTVIEGTGTGDVNPLLPAEPVVNPVGIIVLVGLCLLWLGGHIWLLVAAERARRS